MSGELIVSIVAVVGALILVLPGLRGWPTLPAQRVWMAIAWLVIIVGVVFVIHAFRVGGA